jgi:hypothetical protein
VTEERKRLLPTELSDDFKSKCCLLSAKAKSPADIRILGLGMPFSNPGHQVEQWLKGGPVAGGRTLLDILQAPVVRFVVKRPYGPFKKEWDEKLLPAPFEYPWGTDHTWDEDRFMELYDKYKGAQYPVARLFENDNNHISAMVHSMAQDVIWVVETAREIVADIHDAYFIEVRNKPPRAEYLAVVKLPLDYLDGYEAAWTRLTKDGTLEIDLYTPDDKELSGTWEALLVLNPEASNEFDSQAHPLDKDDLVLRVSRPNEMDHDRGPGCEPVVYAERRLANKANK